MKKDEAAGTHVDLSPVVAAIGVAGAVIPPAITGAVETALAAKAVIAAVCTCATCNCPLLSIFASLPHMAMDSIELL